jgi:hypothetical protein
MEKKHFKLSDNEIKPLIQGLGSCVASDKITVEGLPIGYMYRENPDFETDSGWRFFSGTEDENYMDDACNFMIYDLNTIANYDAAIIDYLNYEISSQLERNGDGFSLVSTPIE